MKKGCVKKEHALISHTKCDGGGACLVTWPYAESAGESQAPCGKLAVLTLAVLRPGQRPLWGEGKQ